MWTKLRNCTHPAVLVIGAYLVCFGPAAVVNQRWEPSRKLFRSVYDIWILMLPQGGQSAVMSYAEWWIDFTGSPPLFRADLEFGSEDKVTLRGFMPPGLILPAPGAPSPPVISGAAGPAPPAISVPVALPTRGK